MPNKIDEALETSLLVMSPSQHSNLIVSSTANVCKGCCLPILMLRRKGLEAADDGRDGGGERLVFDGLVILRLADAVDRA